MDGILIINKPKECTSHDIVYKIKKIFCEKIGHTGTLDPMAQGVLPILIGKGTLCSKYLINHDKTYETTIKLGKRTKTGDSEGEIIEEKEVPKLDEKVIKQILKEFIGNILQTPPIYSAIKVNGKKLYEYARKNQQVEIAPRKINIYNIDLLNIEPKEKLIKINVNCSKGTYIRSLCEDIAKKLGTVGYMEELIRLKVGEFDIRNSITINELEKNFQNQEFINKNIISIEKLFKQKDKIELNEKKLRLFLNGVKLNKELEDGLYRIYTNNKFIGTGIIKNNTLKRDIIL